MAIAPEALEAGEAAEGAGFRGLSAASGQLRRVPGAAVQGTRSAYGAVSTPSSTARTLTKLVWAAAIGIVVLAIATEATGQHWAFSLPGGTGQPFSKGGYQPLYGGASPALLNAADAVQAAQNQALVGIGAVSANPGRSGNPNAVPLGAARG